MRQATWIYFEIGKHLLFFLCLSIDFTTVICVENLKSHMKAIWCYD